MKLALVGFVLRRVRSNLKQLFWTHVLTAGTMALTLFVFGAFMLVEINMRGMLKGWGDQIQIIGYLDVGLPAEDTDAMIRRFAAMPEVESVRHTSQEQAWRDFKAALGSQSGLLDGLPRGILPASIEISLKRAERDVPVVERLAERLKQERGIAAVEYPQEWVERVALAVLAVEWVKWSFGGVLFLATFFIVGSTVKLAVLARRDEVEIMQLVGASEALIQAPFVLEGMIQGVSGALLSVGGLWLAYVLARNELVSMAGLWVPIDELQFLAPGGVGFLLATGWVLGASGSLISLRRFIRSWTASSARR